MIKRGFSVEPHFYHREGGSIEELESWGVNLVRLHLIEGYRTLEQGYSDAMRIALDAFARGSDIKFLWNIRMECSCDYRAHLAWWQEKIKWIDILPNTWGYDVVNEPQEPQDKSMPQWRAVMPTFHQAMRHMTDKYLVFQTGHYGTDSAFEHIVPFGDEKTVYACNIYTPWLWTSQGLNKGGKTGKPFPTDLEREIREEKARLLHFRDKWPDANLMVPELGLSKHIPDEDAERWLDTLLPILEDSGISWCWHVYPGERNRPPRERLKHYFALNSQRNPVHDSGHS